MQGRKPGTQGHLRAREYIQQSFEKANLHAFEENYSHPFQTRGKNAYNLVAAINGVTEQSIVLTAHYDHLGRKGGEVYNGADDNASGVAAMLEIARQLSKEPLKHKVVFVATDAEETGLYGAKHFLNAPPIPVASIRVNINLDMIANGGRKKRLYLAGSKAFPQLKPIVESSIEQAHLCLRIGHDGRSFNFNRQHRINWLRASDHYAFYKQGIPYLFFSAGDHKYYHTPRDTVDYIDPQFYTAAVESILVSIRLLDDAFYKKDS